MSGSGHKDDRSNCAASSTHLRRIRTDARNQREIAASLLQRAGKAQVWATALTESDTLHGRAATPTPCLVEAEAAPAVVAFAGSAGSLRPLITILQALPRNLRAAVLVAVHTGEGSTLLSLLRMRCHLDVSLAETGGVIQRGIVYVAPPLLHLIVNANRTFTVIDKGRLQFARPSADWLFDTIAASYSEYATGIVLSGYRRDGARGITRIRETGGATIVQDPDTCEAKGMPNAAIGTGSVSLVLRPELIAHAIVDRVQAIDVDRNDRDFQNPFAAMA